MLDSTFNELFTKRVQLAEAWRVISEPDKEPDCKEVEKYIPVLAECDPWPLSVLKQNMAKEAERHMNRCMSAGDFWEKKLDKAKGTTEFQAENFIGSSFIEELQDQEPEGFV